MVRLRVFVLFLVCMKFSFAEAVLSPLATPPVWSVLERFQETMSHDTFFELLKNRYSVDGAFLRYCQWNKTRLRVYADETKIKQLFELRFAEEGVAGSSGVTSAEEGRGLRGMKILLDPGHIGGDWSRMEERWFQIGNDPAVEEWELNRAVCARIERELQLRGATVAWTKRGTEPVTSRRPDDLVGDALYAMLTQDACPWTWSAEGVTRRLRKRAELLFYRVSEVRARAEMANRSVRPDVTLCIHFNAAPWGDPEKPQRVETSRLVIFTHGAYLGEELVMEDMKFYLLYKLLSRVHEKEEPLARAIAGEYRRVWPEWSAVDYRGENVVADPVEPMVYARNLLANRLTEGPVLFAEGPYMNAEDAYHRLIAGDYEGEKVVGGKRVRSLFAEYAEAVVRGLERWSSARD
jgi:N-acetylmuramoyl-L-alanine amidase